MDDNSEGVFYFGKLPDEFAHNPAVVARYKAMTDAVEAPRPVVALSHSALEGGATAAFLRKGKGPWDRILVLGPDAYDDEIFEWCHAAFM